MGSNEPGVRLVGAAFPQGKGAPFCVVLHHFGLFSLLSSSFLGFLRFRSFISIDTLFWSTKPWKKCKTESLWNFVF